MSVETTRDQILRAAGPVFADRGYRLATVRDICAAAGVNVAAVNYYFGDKRQLYIQTLQRAHQLRANQIPMPDWPPSACPAEKLRGFVLTLMQRMLQPQDDPWPTRLMLREVLQPTEACSSLVEDYFRPQFELLLSVVDCFLPPGVPSWRRHQLALSVIGQCFFYRTAGAVVPMLLPAPEIEQHFTVERLAEHIADTTLATLKAIPRHWVVQSSVSLQSTEPL